MHVVVHMVVWRLLWALALCGLRHVGRWNVAQVGRETSASQYGAQLLGRGDDVLGEGVRGRGKGQSVMLGGDVVRCSMHMGLRLQGVGHRQGDGVQGEGGRVVVVVVDVRSRRLHRVMHVGCMWTVDSDWMLHDVKRWGQLLTGHMGHTLVRVVVRGRPVKVTW